MYIIRQYIIILHPVNSTINVFVFKCTIGQISFWTFVIVNVI